MFSHPVWRERPLATAYRLLTCHLRKRLPGLQHPVIHYDDGRARMRVDLRTAFGYTLYRYGHRAPDIDLVRTLLKPGGFFVDGGAHVGLFTLVAAARVGASGRVLAFEPAPGTRAQLEENVRVSGFRWVDVRPQALAETPGELEFVSFPAHAWGSSSFAPPADLTGGVRHRVPVTTLDLAIPEADRDRVSLVKLDLEGAEYRALLGAAQLLEGARPDLLLEIEPEHLERQGASLDRLLALLLPLGYRPYSSRWSPAGGVELGAVPEPSGRGETTNLFFTPDPDRARRAGLTVEER